MIATITTHSSSSHRMDAHTHTNRKDRDKDQNRAGGPLPIIPRRRGSSSSSTPSSRPSLTPSVSMPLPAKTSLSSFASSSASKGTGKGTGLMTITTITPATPPKNDSDSSSSSSPSSDGTRPTIRTRRARGVRNNGASSTATTTEWLSPVDAQAQAASAGAQKAFVAFPSQNDKDNAATTASTSHPPPASPSPASSSPSRPLLYQPGMSLRLCVESIKGAARHAVSESQKNVSHSAPLPQTSLFTSALYDVHNTSTTSTPTTTPPPERIVRKKSGQLVKPSLKTSRSNSLSVYTLPLSSKSEPTTPTSKAVHFDTNLEQIKLFLAEQKPLAVSRDGSPTATDDTATSGTESDFPGFIFGGEKEKGEGERRKGRRKLVMHLTNKPALPDPSSLDANTNVMLEDMSLSPEGTSILGKVLVRNLAYAKHVSVRFTFDAWQTTSEVVGKYVESTDGGWDRFGFTIRVGDLLASIEGKRLEVAVRYVVEGREFWDNCGGGNYVAWFEFEKVKRGAGSSTAMGKEEGAGAGQGSPTKKTTFSTLNSEDEADMKDLKTKLEKEANDFRSTQSFAARYDFSSSLKSAAAWNPDRAFPAAGALHSRTQSFPLSSSSSKCSNGGVNGGMWGQKAPSSPYALRRNEQGFSGLPPPSLSASSRPIEIVSPPSQNKGIPAPLLGSPRDLDEGSYAHNAKALRSPLELEDVPFPVQQVEQPAPAQVHSRGGRNHQRGYFDISFPSSSSVSSTATNSGLSSSLRRTPPGTPRSPGEDMYLGSPHRYNSFPSMGSESASGGSERSSSFSSFTSAALSSSFLRDVTPRQQGRPAHSRHHSATTTSTACVLRAAEVTSVPMHPNASNSSTESEESELSTPSMSTPSSSRESSPEVSPAELFVSLEEGAGVGLGFTEMSMGAMSMSPDTHYRQFLNKFCFFTGPNSSISDSSSPQSQSTSMSMSYIYSSSPSPASSTTSSSISTSSLSHSSSSSIPRAHSASEIEALLLGISPRLQAIANGTASAVGGAGASPMWGTPSRSPSFDDLVLGGAFGVGGKGEMGDSGGPGSSGSLTPTPSVSMGLVQMQFAGAHSGHGLGVGVGNMGGGSQQGTPVLA